MLLFTCSLDRLKLLPDVEEGDAVVEERLAALVRRVEVAVVLLQRRRPVHQRQVDVGEAQPREGPLDAGGRPPRGVPVGPDLGGDEELVAGEQATGDRLLDRLAHLVLVLVEVGAVEVAVARLEGQRDHPLRLALGRLVGAQAEDGHRGAVVQLYLGNGGG